MAQYKTSKYGGFIGKVCYDTKRPELATAIPELVERLCKCGCKRKFKVTKRSPQRFASYQCAGVGIGWRDVVTISTEDL